MRTKPAVTTLICADNIPCILSFSPVVTWVWAIFKLWGQIILCFCYFSEVQTLTAHFVSTVKFVPVTFCPKWIPHGPTCERNVLCAMNWRLVTQWNMVRPGLFGCLIVWLVLVVLLVGCFGWLVGFLFRLVGWLVGLYDCWLFGRSFN